MFVICITCNEIKVLFYLFFYPGDPGPEFLYVRSIVIRVKKLNNSDDRKWVNII